MYINIYKLGWSNNFSVHESCISHQFSALILCQTLYRLPVIFLFAANFHFLWISLSGSVNGVENLVHFVNASTCTYSVSNVMINTFLCNIQYVHSLPHSDEYIALCLFFFWQREILVFICIIKRETTSDIK